MLEILTKEILVPLVIAPLVLYLGALARAYVRKAVALADDQLDKNAQERIIGAFDRAIALAEQKGNDADIAQVIRYVRNMNPGDLRRLGLDFNPEKLQKRAEAAVAARKAQVILPPMPRPRTSK